MNTDQRWVALAQDGEFDVVDWFPEADELIGYAHDPVTDRIVRADRLPGFRGYQRRPRVITALPGTGWTVSYRMAAPDGERQERRPVVAWLVYDDGSVVCQDVDDDGLVYVSQEAVNFAGVTLDY